jgi:uncharacterized protein YabN with tetrapyrrole methylase and pyrophosphatase domain
MLPPCKEKVEVACRDLLELLEDVEEEHNENADVKAAHHQAELAKELLTSLQS